jgi:hypothetical protein
MYVQRSLYLDARQLGPELHGLLAALVQRFECHLVLRGKWKPPAFRLAPRCRLGLWPAGAFLRGLVISSVRAARGRR